MEISPTFDLLSRLDASSRNAHNIHDDLCPMSRADHIPCCCGVPDLLRELAVVLRAQEAVALLEAGQLGVLTP